MDRKELDRGGAANRKTGEDRTNEKSIRDKVPKVDRTLNQYELVPQAT